MEKKLYMVVPIFDEAGDEVTDLLDLVSIRDDEDRWMCSPFDTFKAGEILSEDEFVTELCTIVLDDDTERNAYFAFKIPLVDLN
jgi:hypothetical protein